jgi:hypothetical protein
MNVRLFLIGLAALFVATNAAIFSVTGLSMLFAGASLSVIIMAGSLEFAKLTAASFLYYYWDKLNRLIKTYFVIAIIILIFITSLGIYGFLTSAYQKTSDELRLFDSQIETTELRRTRYEQQIQLLTEERLSLNQTVTELSRGLSGNQVQYIDAATGQLITTTSTATRRSFEEQLQTTRARLQDVSDGIEVASDSITAIDGRLLEIRRNNVVAGEIGPLRFMAEVSGLEMNTIVNLFALLIVFVFDPLAVTLVIAFNMGLKFNKESNIIKKIENKELEIYGDAPQPMHLKDIVEESQKNGLYDEPFDNPLIRPDVVEDTEAVPDQPPKSFTTETTPTDNLQLTLDDIEKLVTAGTDTPKQPADTIYPIDIDGDGIIDGYDTNGDGLIDKFEPKTSGRWREMIDKKPYYARSGFDWSDEASWKNDVNAVNYFNTFIAKKYPTNFNSKTY